MFNPNPRIETVTIGGRPLCHVIDNALREPERWVDYAKAHAGDFQEWEHNAYPGPELRMPDDISAQLDAFFSAHIRRHFDVRRTLGMFSRLSMVTRAPHRLKPTQSMCHVDRLNVERGQFAAASVLYLFRDETLGGTSFYRPTRSIAETQQLLKDSAEMSQTEFAARHGIQPGYMIESNAYFEKIHAVPAAWNRLIFYSGMAFHSADIAQPQRLSADPRKGRLTLNAFFTCRRNLA